MISCKEACILTEKQLTHKLSFAERLKLRFHLSICKLCARYNIQSKWLDQVLHNFSKEEHYSESEKEKLKTKLKEAQD